MSPERLKEIRDKGCVVIRDVVDDAEARTWQAWLRDYVAKNLVDGKLFISSVVAYPESKWSFALSGIPVEDKQFFQL